MIMTCAPDASLRASTSITTWSLSRTPSIVHGDSRTPGLTALEGDILAVGPGGGARGDTHSVTTVVIITDLDIIPHMALDLALAVLSVVPGAVDSVNEEEEVAAVQGEHSAAVGVEAVEAVEVVHGGGEVQLSRKLASSSRLAAEQLNPWRQLPILNSNNNHRSSSSHPARRRERASFMELDKLCLVSLSRLV